MTTEIVRRDDVPAPTLPEKMEWARAMASATLLPRNYQNNPGNLLFAVEYADTLGIPRISALTSIHVIDGKPTASSDLIASLVRRAGHKLRVEGDDTYAEAVIIRADDPDYVPKPVRWDEQKARQAGKWGRRGRGRTTPERCSARVPLPRQPACGPRMPCSVSSTAPRSSEPRPIPTAPWCTA